jgi:hypothetical protein
MGSLNYQQLRMCLMGHALSNSKSMTLSVKGKSFGKPFSYSIYYHYAYACPMRGQNFRGDNYEGEDEKDLFDYIAPLCATQVLGQAFFCIPDRPSESNARQRVNTTVVKVVKGVVPSKQIEEEFTRDFPSGWRWTARKVADNTFTIRFPNSLLIEEWSCFNPISMHSVKAKLHIAAWNGLVETKGELEMGWFRVRGVPYDKRSKATMAYVGSLVGATVEVDKSTLGRTNYVRVKIVARDISKVPKRVEGGNYPLPV